MTVKTTQKQSARRTRRTPQRKPVSEVLYDRVTGRSQEVIILPPVSSRMTLRLRPDQRARLDQASRKITRTAGETVSTAAIVRGLLDALMSADLDLSGYRSEADIKAAVLARLARGR